MQVSEGKAFQKEGAASAETLREERVAFLGTRRMVESEV